MRSAVLAVLCLHVSQYLHCNRRLIEPLLRCWAPLCARGRGVLFSILLSCAKVSATNETMTNGPRVLLLSVFVVSLAGPAWAGAPIEINARKAFMTGHYEEAIDLFAQLYSETLHPVYLRNLGRCHQKLGHAAQAIDFFKDYLRKGNSIQPAERAEINGYIADMEKLLAKPPPMPARPATAPVDVTAPPLATPSGPPVYRRWWFWTAVAATISAGVILAVTASHASTNQPPCLTGRVCQ